VIERILCRQSVDGIVLRGFGVETVAFGTRFLSPLVAPTPAMAAANAPPRKARLEIAEGEDAVNVTVPLIVLLLLDNSEVPRIELERVAA
jgi:hypothetical protein